MTDDLFDPPADLNAEDYLASAVSERRDQLEKSQAEVAEQMTKRGHKWTQSTVYKVENGMRKLSFNEGMELARVLELSPYDLLSSSESSVAVQRVLESLRQAWRYADIALERVEAAGQWLEQVNGDLTESELAHVTKAIDAIADKIGYARET